MKKLTGLLGSVLFWVLWPVWFFYLQFSKNRSRVLVVYKGEILLIKPWLGRKNFALPGGGLKKGESSRSAAVRELAEETGIIITPRSLKMIGFYRSSEAGLKYKASLFSVELSSRPNIQPDKVEIWEYIWAKLGDAEKLNLSNITRYALSRYKPQQQGRLL